MSELPTAPLPARPPGASDPCWTDDRPVIPDYEMLRPLDKGAFGEVWMGRSKTGVCHAIKVLPKGRVTDIELEGIRAFETRARSHPNLIQIRHVGETASHFYYVMELADGYSTAPTFTPDSYEPRTAANDLRRRGPCTLSGTIEIARQILAGLAHLHSEDLLHRDVKPGNVVFVDGVAKLADVGLLTAGDRLATKAGTRHYAPPEGVVDRTGDLYCLGKTLYELLTGLGPERFPLPAGAATRSERAAFERLLPILRRACAPMAVDRFQSAQEMAEALDEVDGADRAAGGRLRWVAAGALLVVVLASAIVAWAALGPKPETPPARGGGPAAPTGSFQVHFKKEKDAPTHAVVDAGQIPLRTGEVLRVVARFDRPMYPVVAVLEADTGARIAYPPPDLVDLQSPLRELTVPPITSSGESWWPLDPPGETLTFILLACDRPVGEVDAIAAEITGLGAPPELDPETMLMLADGRVETIRSGGERGIGDLNVTVKAEFSLLDRLPRAFGERFEVVRAISLPLVDASDGP